MSYMVKRAFTDKLTGVVYYPGDKYPRDGEPDAKRVKELSTEANAIGEPLIEADEAEKPEKKPAKAKKPATKKKAE